MCFSVRVASRVILNLITRLCTELSELIFRLTLRNTQLDALYPGPWWFDANRRQADTLLADKHTDGHFLLRPSSSRAAICCLSVWQNGQPYHINVRLREDGLFALGRRKNNECVYTSVGNIIAIHCNQPLLINSEGKQIFCILNNQFYIL